MADHKKQHFVPKFYLKRFSQNGKSINMFNVKSERHINGADIKGQCYRDYFYGKDLVLEKALSQVEGEMGRILESVRSQGMLPARQSFALNTLFFYVLLQHSRTEQFIGVLDAQISGAVKSLVNPSMLAQGYSPQDLEKVRLTIKEAAGLALRQAAMIFPLFLDLDCKLVRITNDQEFITSDSPVVFYNQLLSFQKTGGAGIASKGLQVFFPLDPKHLAILYDHDVYRVGAPKSCVIEIANSNDVSELNCLQFVHALHNVYFFGEAFPARRAYYGCRQYRTPMSFDANTYVAKETGESRKEVFTISQYRPRTNLNLSFVKLLKPAKQWLRQLHELAPRPLHRPVRDQRLIDEHNIFMKLVENGRYQVDEFRKYLREKYPT